MKLLSIAFSMSVIAIGFVGCSSVVDSNKITDFPLPTISTTDSIAEVQVLEPISGIGCSRQWLGFYLQGDETFITSSGEEPKSPLDRAKGAALYKAIRSATDNGLSADIVVNPVWSIVTKDPLIAPFWVHDVCAQVKGFRGVVKGFRAADTITTPGVKKDTDVKFDLNLRGSISGNVPTR